MGQAGVATRVLIAAVFAAVAALCIGGGIAISRDSAAARAVAILLIVPLGFVAAIAAAFVVAPHSRFGAAVDALAAQLSEARVALAIAALLWAAAFVATS